MNDISQNVTVNIFKLFVEFEVIQDSDLSIIIVVMYILFLAHLTEQVSHPMNQFQDYSGNGFVDSSCRTNISFHIVT